MMEETMTDNAKMKKIGGILIAIGGVSVLATSVFLKIVGYDIKNCWASAIFVVGFSLGVAGLLIERRVHINKKRAGRKC
jgi:hypothetical protein